MHKAFLGSRRCSERVFEACALSIFLCIEYPFTFAKDTLVLPGMILDFRNNYYDARLVQALVIFHSNSNFVFILSLVKIHWSMVELLIYFI